MSPKDSKKKDAASTALVPFEKYDIRRTWYQERWYYSITDIIAALTANSAPRQYNRP